MAVRHANVKAFIVWVEMREGSKSFNILVPGDLKLPYQVLEDVSYGWPLIKDP